MKPTFLKSLPRIGLLIAILSSCSCSKIVQVDPPASSLTGENIFTTDATAVSVLTGIYTNLSSASYYPFATGVNSISLICGLSADEFTLFGGSSASPDLQNFYQNNLSQNQYTNFWNSLYLALFQINSAIDGLNSTTSLTPSVKKQLLGEAYFLRAFVNFYLVNLYGNVPIVTTNDYKVNGSIATSPKSDLWKLIIVDLNTSVQLLSDNYLDGTLLNTTNERVRPTKWSAEALLSRSYLYTNNWDSAEIAATTVINNSSMYTLDSLNAVFLRNSTEAIWQLPPVYDGHNTQDAEAFILIAGPNTYSNPVYLSNFLLQTFEANDARYTNWVAADSSTGVTYYYPYKYKSATYNTGSPITEYLMVLRLAELYLIRAEARAQKNEIPGAQNDLNVIRNRSNLANTSASDQEDLLKAILHERQVEYFSEWGNRWLDLKRTGMVDSVMSLVTPQKGGDWNSNWQLYPVPFYDIQQDSHITQNIGY